MHVLVHLRITAYKVPRFLALAAGHAAASRREPGCLRFEVLRHADDPERFAFDEVFADQAALDAHRETRHYHHWRLEIAELQAEPRTHDEYERLVGAVVFANGCFDMLHAGHLHCLLQARQQGDKLIVGLNSDASVRRLKGPGRPLVPLRERAAVLGNLRCVDEVICFDTEAELRVLIDTIRPAVLVKGSDAAGRPVTGAEFAGRVHFVPRLGEHSTTALLRRMAQ